MSASIITQKSGKLRQHFDSEEELQDLLTKRMLEQGMVNDDQDDLGQDGDGNQQYDLPGSMSDRAKAKTRQLK